MHEGVWLAQIALDEYYKTKCEKMMYDVMGMDNGCKCPRCET